MTDARLLSASEILEQIVREGETEIFLSHGRQDHNGLGQPYTEAIALAIFLGEQCKLLKVTILGNPINDVAAEALGRALPCSTSLRYLHLRGNGITSAGFKAIAEGASQCRSLGYVCLADQANIGVEGIKVFAECNSPFLKTLSLRGIGIGDDGMPFVATLLRNTTSLLSLDLSLNNISDTYPIADALSFNSTLLSLDLSDNNITDNGIRGLAKVIYFNSRLLFIALVQNHQLTRDGAGPMLEAALSHNDVLLGLFISSGFGLPWRDKLERRRRMSHRLSLTLLEFPYYPKTPMAESKDTLADTNDCAPSTKLYLAFWFIPATMFLASLFV